MRAITARLMAERCFDYQASLGFRASETGETCALKIRRGICRFHQSIPDGVGAVLRFERLTLTAWLFGQVTVEEALADRRMELEGDGAMVSEFLSKFEQFNQADPIAIAAGVAKVQTRQDVHRACKLPTDHEMTTGRDLQAAGHGGLDTPGTLGRLQHPAVQGKGLLPAVVELDVVRASLLPVISTPIVDPTGLRRVVHLRDLHDVGGRL